MTDNIKELYPFDDFKNVVKEAEKETVCGVFIGLDKDGYIYGTGGGMHKGKRLSNQDALWLLETFKAKIIAAQPTK